LSNINEEIEIFQNQINQMEILKLKNTVTKMKTQNALGKESANLKLKQ
jgi:hypothetical protein